jgi:glutamate N-acetyltransferase/amino-acid N-acetyltransferase
MMETTTPLSNGDVTSASGFLASAVSCGIKKNEALDLALVYSEEDCTAAAMFTQNQVVAAPVILDQDTLRSNDDRVRGVIANAGNANASTGKPGLENARVMQRIAAQHLGCHPHQILLLSTGVIGVQLPMDKIQAGIRAAAPRLSPAEGKAAARAIMTTDTHPKQLAVRVKLTQGEVTIGGMAKGAGMIHPNMATMLALLTTDAAIPPPVMRRVLKNAVDHSFNRISIDGDTSTNDTVLLLANGASGVSATDGENEALFESSLTSVCIELAKMIVRDGEGATKFVEILVTGCRNKSEAHAIAQTIATSALVKTAFAGSDANWGRILAAAGRAGVAFDQDKVSLWVSDNHASELQLVSKGTPTEYQETDAAAIFARSSFAVRLYLGQGNASATMWTSDLTEEYVRINADYRT